LGLIVPTLVSVATEATRWDPTQKQEAEADTLLLFDGKKEQLGCIHCAHNC
jgi:hypothetical protein